MVLASGGTSYGIFSEKNSFLCTNYWHSDNPPLPPNVLILSWDSCSRLGTSFRPNEQETNVPAASQALCLLLCFQTVSVSLCEPPHTTLCCRTPFQLGFALFGQFAQFGWLSKWPLVRLTEFDLELEPMRKKEIPFRGDK